ncbi:MAG: AAA family ATPase [Desulfovibrio sp.]|jgi:hypothetical protein|nr:AAA family ATPase [Desulfovibrio sp.]
MNILQNIRIKLGKPFKFIGKSPEVAATESSLPPLRNDRTADASIAATPLLQNKMADFKSIREENYIYVDKTQYLVKLLTKDKRVFIARPRRFGKSLMIEVLLNIYQGNTHLFKGLEIEKYLDDTLFSPRPVIYLNFADVELSRGMPLIEQSLIEAMIDVAKANGLDLNTLCNYRIFENDLEKQTNTSNLSQLASSILAHHLASTTTPTAFLRNIITTLASTHGKVVILIDEYDRPLVNTHDEPEFQNKIRDLFKDFYAMLKSCEKSIHVLYITGISRFSGSEFSSNGNNITDYSFDPEFNAMFGFTKEEIEKAFDSRINDTAEKMDMDRMELLDRLENYYDGYSF